MTGQAAVPHGPSKGPRSRDQRCLPSMEQACRPPLPNEATTISPSVAHEADAQLFISWIGSGSPVHATCSQSILPLRASTHKTTRSRPFSRAEVRKIRSPQTIGDDWPIPVSGVFQATDSALHLSGRFVSVECPSPRGPRQRGQFDSADDSRTMDRRITAAGIRYNRALDGIFIMMVLNTCRCVNKNRILSEYESAWRAAGTTLSGGARRPGAQASSEH